LSLAAPAAMMAGMKLLIVDDHPILREGLAAVLRQVEPETVVLQAGSVAEGLDALAAHADLDAVLLDLAMPGMGGLPAIREFGRRRPELAVVVVSSSEAPQDVRQALASGALGYVPKSATPQTLLAALRFVLAGNVYVPPLVLGEARGPAGNGDAAPPPLFTPRQLDVLKQLAAGHSNKEIAIALGLSDKTVKQHITAIFKALNVVNRTQAANAAQRCGLI
jgi:two-component system, NarL family, nitrate/nitrite response regulator NarL